MPIHHLPGDVLVEVFTLCLPKFPDDEAWATRNKAPLLFTEVCISWRELALSVPSLWSEIVVGVDDSASVAQLANQVKIWLTRSSEVPLSVKLCLDFSSKGGEEKKTRRDVYQQSDNFAQLLTIFFDHIHRWRIMILELPAHGDDFPRTEVPPHGAPLLEHLSIKYEPGGLLQEGNLNDHHFERLLLSPNLRHFHCPAYGLEYGGGVDDLEPWWSQTTLTSVEINYCTPYDILTILKFAPTIQDFSSDLRGRNISLTPTFIFDVEHQNLQTLRLISNRLQCTNTLQYLTLPSLRRFTFHSMSFVTSIPVLSAFFSRSNCPLQNLDLKLAHDQYDDVPEDDPPTITGCLSEVANSLEVLSLDFDDLEPEDFIPFLSSLTVPADDMIERNCLFPELASLQVDRCSSLPDQLIRDVIISRNVMHLVHWDHQNPRNFSLSDPSDCDKVWTSERDTEKYLLDLGPEHVCRKVIDEVVKSHPEAWKYEVKEGE